MAVAVTEVRNSNSGWDEAVPNPNVESGWEKQMKHLPTCQSIMYRQIASPPPLKINNFTVIIINKNIQHATNPIKQNNKLLFWGVLFWEVLLSGILFYVYNIYIILNIILFNF